LPGSSGGALCAAARHAATGAEERLAGIDAELLTTSDL
jgi:hypothetical protein